MKNTNVIVYLLLAVIIIALIVMLFKMYDDYLKEKTVNTRRIKYAIANTIELSSCFTDEDIERIIKSAARDNEYIWCDEDEDLFDFDKE